MTSTRILRRAGFLAAFTLLAASGTALTGCTEIVAPVTAQRGYIVNETDLKKVKPKITSKGQVQEYMGTPSTVSTIDGEAWYYISSKTEAFLYNQPEEVERTVIAVYFDQTDTVQELLFYGMQDGEIVDLQTRVTPTRGKELTILGQLFGNLGRFNKNTPK
tara:strand:- start:152766 stop:153248 length:483 start_codon:yes stop_codon:yes gene_type:complete